MGRTGAKSTQKSGNLTDGLRKKDLKLTVIFAPVSRSELFDIYNPVECPVVDRQMRVISRLVDSSGEYTPETQDKVIFINCASANCIAQEDGPIIDLTPESLTDKLGRAIQLIHELLDYWHGYYGTVFTTFCCYQPLEGLMAALQTVLNCPPFISSQGGVGVSMGVPAQFEDAMDLYYEWTFVAKHSSVYKGEFKYEVYNELSEEENLKKEIEDILANLTGEAKEKFQKYLESEGMYRTQNRFALESFCKRNPEYQGYLNTIDKDNKRIKAIEEQQKKDAEEWSHKSEAQRRGKVKRDINKYYDDKIKKTQAKNDPFMRELQEKRKQLAYQQEGTSQFNPDEAKRAYDAYDYGVEYHGETHSRDTIEYEGEYYTMDELDRMYNALKYQKDILEQQREKAWRKARDDIRKQVYLETLDAGLAIFGIVSIVFTPLVLVDVIVVVGKMFTVKGYKEDWRNWAALGLDLFALVPFVGAVFKVGGRVTHVAVAETIFNDVTKEGKGVFNAGLTKAQRASTTEAQVAGIELGQTKNLVTSMAEKEVAETASAEKLTTRANELNAKGYEMQDMGIAYNKAGNYEAGDALLEASGKFWEENAKAWDQIVVHETNAEAAKAAREAAQLKIPGQEQALFKANQEALGVTPNYNAGAGEVAKTLPIVSLGGYINDLTLYIKNFANMSGGGRAAVGGNLGIQTTGRVGNVITFDNSVSTLSDSSSSSSYSVQTNGDDFVLVLRN